MSELQFYLPFVYVIVGLIGLAVGSFLNVVIYRVPREESIAWPGSHCTTCDYELKWYDNIPVLSYIILGGKCRKCKQHISMRYTIVELLNTVLWLACVFFFIDKPEIALSSYTVEALDAMAGGLAVYAFLAMVVCSSIICIAFIDLEHTFIPDRFHIINAACAIAAIVSTIFYQPDGLMWYDRLIGGVGAGLLFLAIYYGCILVLKREGMGFGDVKLVAGMGLFIGWKNMILAIFLAAILAVIVLVAVHIKNKESDRFHEYPFAPYLALGMLIAMLVGSPIINWYLTISGLA